MGHLQVLHLHLHLHLHPYRLRSQTPCTCTCTCIRSIQRGLETRYLVGFSALLLVGVGSTMFHMTLKYVNIAITLTKNPFSSRITLLSWSFY